MNRYAGTCFGCGEEVPEKAGEVLRVNGRWRVTHVGCHVYHRVEIISADGGRLPPLHPRLQRLLDDTKADCEGHPCTCFRA